MATDDHDNDDKLSSNNHKSDSKLLKWIGIIISSAVLIISAVSLILQIGNSKLLQSEITEKIRPTFNFDRFSAKAMCPFEGDTSTVIVSGDIGISNRGEYSCTIDSIVYVYAPYVRHDHGVTWADTCAKNFTEPGANLRKGYQISKTFGPHIITCNFKEYDRMRLSIFLKVSDINKNRESVLLRDVFFVKSRKNWTGAFKYDPMKGGY